MKVSDSVVYKWCHEHRASMFQASLVIGVALLIITALGTANYPPMGIAGKIGLGLSLVFLTGLVIMRIKAMQTSNPNKYTSRATDFGLTQSQAIDPQWNSWWYSLKTSRPGTKIKQFLMIRSKIHHRDTKHYTPYDM